MECNLNPNGKIMLIKRKENGIVGIYKKDDIVDITNPIYDLGNKVISLEEYSVDDENKAKLVAINPFCVGDYEYYALKIINIDLVKSSCGVTEFLSIERPRKVSDSFYMFRDTDKEICFVDKDYVHITLEKAIKVWLSDKKVNMGSINLSCFDSNNCPNIYELTIELGNVETLHIFLKIGKDIEFYNTFYSEMANGKSFVFCETCSGDSFIDQICFSSGLVNHQIIKEIEYISDYENKLIIKTKGRIREKVLDEFGTKSNS